MRAFFSGVVRVCLLTAACVTTIAIVVGRLHGEIPDERRAATPGHHPISGYLFKNPLSGLALMDVETGQLEQSGPGGPRIVEHAAIAPWRDGQGRAHAAGMWIRPARHVGEASLGLGHYTLPDWEALDEVETEVIPASPICWFPDTTTRILFAGRDGRLYRYSFDEPAAGPQPLEWRVEPPRGPLIISDPLWPAVSAPFDRIVVSMTDARVGAGTGDGPPPGLRSHLWWLRLDPDGTAIEAAGRLISPSAGDAGAAAVDEEMPAIARGTDGGLTLAYLVHRRWEGSHRLRLAPLLIDDAGRMHADGRDAVEAPGRRIRARPVFSKDGLRVRALRDPAVGHERAASVGVAELLSSGGTRMTAARPEFGGQVPGS